MSYQPAPQDRPVPRHKRGVRALSLGFGALLLPGLVPPPAHAAVNLDTTQFFQTFSWSSVSSLWPVRKPASISGQANSACLTASGSRARYPLPSCTTVLDGDGRGTLRLTAAAPSQLGAVFAADTQPFSHGLDATFTTYQYGSDTDPGNGIAFAVAASDPRTSEASVRVGAGDGSLGYAAATPPTQPGHQQPPPKPGLSQAYLGVDLDAAGTASTPTFQGDGCDAEPASTMPSPGQVVVRGPGDATHGYCLLNSTTAHAVGPLVLRGPQRDKPLRGVDRTGLAVRVEIALNPNASPVATASGWPVQARSYLVVVRPLAGPVVVLQGRLPDVPDGLYPDSWRDHDNLPRRIVVGVSASTGTSSDAHEVQDLLVSDLLPSPASNSHLSGREARP